MKPWEEFAAEGPWTEFQDEPADDAYKTALRGASEKTKQLRGADPSMLETAALGAARGISSNFHDELVGLSEASGLPNWMGGLRAPVGAYKKYIAGDKEAQQTAAMTEAAMRDRWKLNEEVNPGTALASEITGSVALPGGSMLKGGSMLNRMGRGAMLGGGYGAAAGLGEGEGAGDRLSRAGRGMITGGVFGAGAVPVAEKVIQKAGDWVVKPAISTIRGLRGTEDELARRVAEAYQGAAKADPAARRRMTRGEFEFEPDATVADLIGERGKSLIRSAADNDPDAHSVLSNFYRNRFEDSGDRLAERFDSFYNFPNPKARKTAIDSLESAVDPAYERVMKLPHAQSVWSEELERLGETKEVQAAMKRAIDTWETRGVLSGSHYRRKPNVFLDEFGEIKFQKDGRPHFPELRVWDYTRRELRGLGEEAGSKEAASRYFGLAKRIGQEIDDNIVPEYAGARAKFKAFADAESAPEAGRAFVSLNKGVAEVKDDLAKMSKTERRLFEDSFVEEYIGKLKQISMENGHGAARNAVREIYRQPQARGKIEALLGPQRAAQLEAKVRLENIMRMPNDALGGSQTSRWVDRARDLGVAGGFGGMGWYLSGDPTHAGIGGLVYAMRAGARRADANMATKIAEALTSRDLDVVDRGIRLLASRPKLMEKLRAFDDKLTVAFSQQAGSYKE